MPTPALKCDESSGPSAIRPTVVVSQCLGFAAVRYNGAMLQDDFVRALVAHVNFVQVCPEVGIGLGVPRDPIRIIAAGDEQRLVQPSTGKDLSAPMTHYATKFVDKAGPIDGFILKSRSPSCGIKGVKLHADQQTPRTVGKTSGFFARAVLERFPSAIVEDEGRLTNFALRHHFLVRVFASARFRHARGNGRVAALVEFHTAHKLQLMAYSPAGLRALGQIVANSRNLPVNDVFDHYSEKFARVTAKPAKPPSNVNVMQHAFGYVSNHLTVRERKHFLGLLEDYVRGRVPLSACISLLESWVVRFEEPYLARQTFFEPYPRPLMTVTDSGAVVSFDSPRKIIA